MANRPHLILGTRGSELALWQARQVRESVERLRQDIQVDIKIIKTKGDEVLDVPLANIGDKGLFVKQLETALLNGEIDIAVHSLKDMQTVQPEGLSIGAVLKRERPNDVLVSEKYDSVDALPRGATVATGSVRRASQLLHYRPDLRIIDIRGNIQTRLEKLKTAGYDAMILAYAGLHRLGLDAGIRQIIPFEIMVPAVGQGAIGIEIRSEDEAVKEMVNGINDEETAFCTRAERSFLRELEGGCHIPIGATAEITDGVLYVLGSVGSLDGRVDLRDSISGDSKTAEFLGTELAKKLLAAGGSDILAEMREKDDS